MTLIGAGGIGAATALALAKMGVGALVICDGDVVDDVNLATQLHRLSDVGSNKSQSVSQTVFEFADDTDVIPHPFRITPENRLFDQIVISAVDSIQARKDIWQAVLNGKVRWYLDARMAAEEFHLYVVDMEGDRSWYETMLSGETDENVPDLPCTRKATIYTAFIAAGQIALAVKRIAVGQFNPRVFVYNIANSKMAVVE